MLRREVVEPRRELTLRRSLVDVRVPAADVGERHLEADVRLRQLRDLLQRLAERAAGIVGAVFRLVFRRVGDLQHLDGVERLAADAVQHAIGRRAYCASNEAPSVRPSTRRGCRTARSD